MNELLLDKEKIRKDSCEIMQKILDIKNINQIAAENVFDYIMNLLAVLMTASMKMYLRSFDEQQIDDILDNLKNHVKIMLRKKIETND